MEQENKTTTNEQVLTLTNRKNLTVTGVEKIVSLKPELIQLNTNNGGLIIAGTNLELVKLDNNSNKADITGNVDNLKFIEPKSKEPFFRKLFK